MTKIKVQEAIDGVLNSINAEQDNYNNALAKDDILAIRKAIRIRIKELNEQLTDLYKKLEKMEEQ